MREIKHDLTLDWYDDTFKRGGDASRAYAKRHGDDWNKMPKRDLEVVQKLKGILRRVVSGFEDSQDFSDCDMYDIGITLAEQSLVKMVMQGRNVAYQPNMQILAYKLVRKARGMGMNVTTDAPMNVYAVRKKPLLKVWELHKDEPSEVQSERQIQQDNVSVASTSSKLSAVAKPFEPPSSRALEGTDQTSRADVTSRGDVTFDGDCSAPWSGYPDVFQRVDELFDSVLDRVSQGWNVEVWARDMTGDESRRELVPFEWVHMEYLGTVCGSNFDGWKRSLQMFPTNTDRWFHVANFAPTSY